MYYIKRIIDKEIDLKSEAFGGIQIVGPKGCGKTKTAKERCKTYIEFEDEDNRASYLSVANVKPSLFLENEKPILFDEWQDAPSIWGMVRKACDDGCDFGSFYLTGSSSKKVETAHSGIARITTIEMTTMSLFESGESNGLISLKELFENPNKEINCKSNLTIEKLIDATCRGGWPKTLEIKREESKLLLAKDYYYQICNDDISRIDNVKRNPDWTKSIIKAYARNIGTLCKNNVIYADASTSYGFSIDTFNNYVDKLKELYVIKDYDAWCPHIRTEKSLRAQKKHMFIDPSIAVAAMNLSNKYFYTDLDYFGHMFESLVYRDLTVYSNGLQGYLSHYHDKFDLEIDAVLHLEDGRYALIEIKLGSKEIEKAERNLLKVKSLIKENNLKEDSIKIREPDLMLVITAGEYAYTLDSGVKVIPIGCLKD
ncbi:MAG: DUF4143 domain-containing protein [Clostridia bacterium]|nr:DUF4143 domain-containing protein [Clostridia bacterium]